MTAVPRLLPDRWVAADGHRAWVRMVATGPHITWVARDVLEALRLPLGDRIYDASLEVSQDAHVRAEAWRTDSTPMRHAVAASADGREFAMWMRSRETLVRLLGFDAFPPIDEIPFGVPTTPITIDQAVGLLLLDPTVRPRPTRPALFKLLTEHGWIRAVVGGYVPSALAVTLELIQVAPTDTPVGTWDQVLLTPTGFEQLHRRLADASVLFSKAPA